jgi:hypothetical protein
MADNPKDQQPKPTPKTPPAREPVWKREHPRPLGEDRDPNEVRDTLPPPKKK